MSQKKIMSKIPLVLTLMICLVLVLPAKKGDDQAVDQSVFKSMKYREIGPTRQSGRFVDFAFPKQEPYTFYAATGSGGLWKTSNNGITFEPLFTNEKVFSIGDVEVAPSDANIVWVGSGEANNSRSTYWGDGVYKSVDAGKTWKNMGLKESHHIGGIQIHPTNPNILYVAALGHLYSENPDRGLYKTTNGGRTWKKVLDIKVKNRQIGVVDVQMDPSNPDVLYAATYDKVRLPFTFDLGGPGGGIYKTENAGKTWSKLGGGLPGGMLGRIGLAIYPKNSNTVFACVENANKKGMSDEGRLKELLEHKASRGMIDGEIYRSDDAGLSWKKINSDKQNIGGGPGYYYGKIYVDPNNDQVLHVLSAASWGTKDGGKTWQRRPLGFGGDDHALWIDPKNSNHIVIGYDHGLGITYDGGKKWQHPDNQPLAQFYAVGFDMSYPYNVAGGLQDNGSHMGPSSKPGGAPIGMEDWLRVGGGDGMYNEFDWKTNRFLYNESQFGPISRLDLVTGQSKSIRYSDNKLRYNWNAPIVVSSHNSDVIYHGSNKLLKSPFRGEYWEVVSPDLTTNNPAFLTTGKGGDGNIQYCTITTISESVLDANEIWVGTDDGNVQVTRDGGKKWTNLREKISGNPGYWVSRVEASHHYPGTAYVSYTGLRRDDFRPFVYKTTDWGETWASIAANLPQAPVNVIREDHRNPNLLFVGCEPDTFVSLDGGKVWNSLKGNMPTQPIYDLKIHPRENDLIVATHGRGIWIADISALQGLSAKVLEMDAYLLPVEPKVKWNRGVTRNSSSANFNGVSEPTGLVISYYLKSDVKGEVKVEIFKGAMLINELKGSKSKGVNEVLWRMDKKRASTGPMTARQRMMMRYMGRGGNLVQEGDYLVVLTVGDKKFKRKATILKDIWTK